MTTTPPRKHALPSMRRGLRLQGDIRFCFVVYEDNEQEEAGDTLTHTWNKSAWPICETRWFYFVGSQNGTPSVSETAIFKFHFPAPPPEPPPPIKKFYFADPNNRSIRSTAIIWPDCWNGADLEIQEEYDPPLCMLFTGYSHTIRWRITRGFLTFNTFTLPVSAKIQSASLYLFIERLFPAAGSIQPLCITLGHQSDPVVTNDWFTQNPETDIGGSVKMNEFTPGQYNAIPLNSIGYSFVNLGQSTRLCIRVLFDVQNTNPGVGAVATAWYHTYQKGAGYRPYIEINYYPA